MPTEVQPARLPARPGILNRILRNTFRVLFLTLLLTGLGMAVGLTIGILATIIGGIFTHHLDMTRAYRFFAIPLAILVGSCGFVYQVVQAIRNPR